MSSRLKNVKFLSGRCPENSLILADNREGVIMEYFNSLVGFLSQPYMKLILSLFVSFAITFYGIPAVVSLAKAKSLYDMPNRRTSHHTPVPRLGGTMIFAGVILSSVIFTSFFTAYELKYIIAGMIILFFLGLKDDIIS
jgi:UDP-GlcNAc:undecaprenyl-phosphate GlcNAc-1-phosphate transferase